MTKRIENTDTWFNMETAKLECSIQENIPMDDLYLRYREDKGDIILVQRSTKKVLFKKAVK